MTAPDRKSVSVREFFCLLLTGVCVFVMTGWAGLGILQEIGCERLGGTFEGTCGWAAVGYLIEYGIPTALLLWVIAGSLVLRWLRRPGRRQRD